MGSTVSPGEGGSAWTVLCLQEGRGRVGSTMSPGGASGFRFRVLGTFSFFEFRDVYRGTSPSGAGDLGAEPRLGGERVDQQRGGEEQILALCAPGVQG